MSENLSPMVPRRVVKVACRVVRDVRKSLNPFPLPGVNLTQCLANSDPLDCAHSCIPQALTEWDVPIVQVADTHAHTNASCVVATEGTDTQPYTLGTLEILYARPLHT